MRDDQRKAAIEGIERAPFSVVLGIKIESASEGKATIRLPFDTRNLNLGGPTAPVHGGAISALIDTAACASVWTLPQTVRSATVSISINYVAAAIQTDLVANAVVRRHGRNMASVAVEVRDKADVLVADGLVTYKIA